VFVNKFAGLPFLKVHRETSKPAGQGIAFTQDDDLDLCLYYLRTLSSVLRWAPDIIWAVLASKAVAVDASEPAIAQTSMF
jgi:hypothetical protein